jgi:hypothetical protein
VRSNVIKSISDISDESLACDINQDLDSPEKKFVILERHLSGPQSKDSDIANRSQQDIPDNTDQSRSGDGQGTQRMPNRSSTIQPKDDPKLPGLKHSVTTSNPVLNFSPKKSKAKAANFPQGLKCPGNDINSKIVAIVT